MPRNNVGKRKELSVYKAMKFPEGYDIAEIHITRDEFFDIFLTLECINDNWNIYKSKYLATHNYRNSSKEGIQRVLHFYLDNERNKVVSIKYMCSTEFGKENIITF